MSSSSSVLSLSLLLLAGVEIILSFLAISLLTFSSLGLPVLCNIAGVAEVLAVLLCFFLELESPCCLLISLQKTIIFCVCPIFDGTDLVTAATTVTNCLVFAVALNTTCCGVPLRIIHVLIVNSSAVKTQMHRSLFSVSRPLVVFLCPLVVFPVDFILKAECGKSLQKAT